MKRALFLLLLCCLTAVSLKATHNRAGEITYRYLGGFQYEATIITYTFTDSPADRPELGINWGDGSTDTIPRINGNGDGEIIGNQIKKNIYIGLHTFPGPAVYEISFEDPNRNGGVVNIPNSVNIAFFVSSTLIINPFLGVNNSCQLLNPPIDQACAGQVFVHNAGAFDPDGDSLSYRIVECRAENGEVIPGFTQPPATQSFSLDPFTGDLVWDSPPSTSVGEFNVAFVIEEWRQGILVGRVTRDMQITVTPCNNQPPIIAALPSLCVDAGTTINFQVQATDPDNPMQLLTLSATGGPFLSEPPYQAEFAAITGNGTVSQPFNWLTDCRHVRLQPYTISFKAIDNGNPNLSAYRTVSVRVVAQAPENLSASALGNAVVLNWSASPCPQAIGYAIYRRSGFYGFVPDTCETGVPAYTGYSLLDTVSGINTLSFTDGLSGSNLLPGQRYCYMVVALFPDGAESYASQEACVELPDILPVITHVSVDSTSSSSGRIWVAWSRPDSLDAQQWPGPYRYVLERAQDFEGNAYSTVANFGSLNDTTFVDSLPGLNTLSSPWHYRVRLDHAGTPNGTIGQGLPSSSVFLSTQSSDNTIVLQWAAQVLWENAEYTVYRKNAAGIWDSIATRTQTSYADTGLANGVEYCYRIRSKGAFSAGGFVHPIFNFSQERCTSAIDTIPPCVPPMHVASSCDSIRNRLSWSIPADACANDIASWELYFREPLQAEWIRLDSVNRAVLEWVHFPETQVAGCYALVAVDSFSNRSAEAWACADNCPEYPLPNVFSPNGDGLNDMFRPFPYRWIAHVDFKVYNRWGILVFETDDRDLGWNGRIRNTGAVLPDGVYFYRAVVHEQRLTGLVPRSITGTIQITGSKQTELD
jgi:gliding motility-associated-like protein